MLKEGPPAITDSVDSGHCSLRRTTVRTPFRKVWILSSRATAVGHHWQPIMAFPGHPEAPILTAVRAPAREGAEMPPRCSVASRPPSNTQSFSHANLNCLPLTAPQKWKSARLNPLYDPRSDPWC